MLIITHILQYSLRGITLFVAYTFMPQRQFLVVFVFQYWLVYYILHIQSLQ